MSLNTDSNDPRLSQLQKWLETVATPRLAIASLRPASADASFRRYFRVDTEPGEYGGSLIVMDAPPPQEDVKPFIHVADLFAATGVSVPRILAQDATQGFLLLTDLGATTYLNQLNIDTAHKLYIDAIDALVLLQTQSKPEALPPYDRALLQRELNLFPEWYIGRHLNTALTDEQSASLNKVFDVLLANNLAQPQVYVHRDYHSRNLMVLPAGNPGILDFQDAVFGPITYDLVSLLRDAYIQWDEEMVLDWMIRYWERAKRAGLPVNPDIDSFYRDFEFMGLQRHLKVLGIFARLAHRDGKDAYLRDIPLVMEYTMKTARRYRELMPLVRLLEKLEDSAPQVGYTFLMKAMILAAGRGERMRPLTDECPKPLLKVRGRPLIVWQILSLVRAGITEIVINHAHLGHMIEAALGDGAQYGAQIRYSPEQTALETAGGIAQARHLLGEQPFVALSGDIFCPHFNYEQVLNTLEDKDMWGNPWPEGQRDLAWLYLVKNPDFHPQGDFALHNFSIANQDDDGGPLWTFANIGVYRPELFDGITPGENAKLGTLLRRHADRGVIGGEVYRGQWFNVGTPEQLAQLNAPLTTA